MNRFQKLGMIGSFVAATFATSARSTIRQIDFQNFTFAWTASQEAWSDTWRWLSPIPHDSISVANGTHIFHFEDQDEEETAPFLTVDSVSYGDLLRDGKEEAIVTLNFSTGGTSNWSFLYIYQLKAGNPVLIAVLQAGSRGSGGLIKQFVRNGLLVADFADKDRLQGDCCSSGYIRVRYRWKDHGFVQSGDEVHGDMVRKQNPNGIYQWEEIEVGNYSTTRQQ